jgi:hypothetical protein
VIKKPEYTPVPELSTPKLLPLGAWTHHRYLIHSIVIVRLGGFRAELRVGDKIEIQYRKKQALFQVS